MHKAIEKSAIESHLGIVIGTFTVLFAGLMSYALYLQGRIWQLF